MKNKVGLVMPKTGENVAFSTSERKAVRVLLLAFIYAFIPTWIWMWERWFARDSYYSHGILVPFVSGYLVWAMRDELADIPRNPSPWGMVFIIFGAWIHLFSSVFRVYFSAGFSMLAFIIGLVLMFFGRDVLRKVLFPVLFLVFMIPLPLIVVINASFKMKILAAEIAERVLNHMGLYALRDGSMIRMQHTHVIVDDVCSGLRSLISLLSLGAIFAYWLKGNFIKKIFLFLTAIPVAVVTNVCRVIFLSAVSEIWGPEYGTGFVHDLTGWLVFVLAFAMLYAVGKLLE